MLNPGGSLSGGAFKNASNLLGRKREMDELELVRSDALKQIDVIHKDLVFYESILEEKSQELTRTNKELQAKYLEENTARVSHEQLCGKKEELEESSGDMVLENKQLEDQIREIRDSIREVVSEIEKLDSENNSRDERILRDTAALENAKVLREDASKDLSEVQLRGASLNQQISFASENLKRVNEEMTRLLREKGSLDSGSSGSEEAVRDKKKKIDSLLLQIEQIRKRAEAHKDEVKSAQTEKDTITEGQKQFFEKREELTDRLSRLDKDLFRLQNQKEKQEEKRDSFVDYMWNEYELTYSSAKESKDESLTSVAEMKRQIAERKNSIRALGHVNVNAIEDYKEISERYTFMKTQHEDLVTAQEALYKIIEELDSGMRRQFAEKFAQIRTEFDRVFKELFGGGHGTLELMEDADILEAGIQIISQPPGKKLQNMMQMSGGEKALTAIALLFAIQNLKPSPFCLLDEIEAALDDSNVDRYAKYLHKLTKHTQFIVITHRRGTMVAADRLYGITMQEKGVSTLVSVNLIENDLDK